MQREETREINGDKRRDVRGKEGQPGRDKLPRTCVKVIFLHLSSSLSHFLSGKRQMPKKIKESQGKKEKGSFLW